MISLSLQFTKWCVFLPPDDVCVSTEGGGTGGGCGGGAGRGGTASVTLRQHRQWRHNRRVCLHQWPWTAHQGNEYLQILFPYIAFMLPSKS